jgi:hypothetical protein
MAKFISLSLLTTASWHVDEQQVVITYDNVRLSPLTLGILWAVYPSNNTALLSGPSGTRGLEAPEGSVRTCKAHTPALTTKRINIGSTNKASKLILTEGIF